MKWVHYNLAIGSIAFTAILSTTLYGGALMFYTSLSKGSAQISGAITATVPAFITVLSILFLGVPINTVQLAILAVITIGLLIVSWPANKSKLDRGVSYAIGAVLLWAIYFTFISRSIETIGPFWANYISVLTGAILLTIYGLIKLGKNLYKIDSRSMVLLAISAIFIGGAPLAFSLALESAPPSVVAPIAGS